jgi:hypothetical protein
MWLKCSEIRKLEKPQGKKTTGETEHRVFHIPGKSQKSSVQNEAVLNKEYNKNPNDSLC